MIGGHRLKFLSVVGVDVEEAATLLGEPRLLQHKVAYKGKSKFCACHASASAVIGGRRGEEAVVSHLRNPKVRIALLLAVHGATLECHATSREHSLVHHKDVVRVVVAGRVPWLIAQEAADAPRLPISNPACSTCSVADAHGDR